MPGLPETLIILAIILLLFGATQVPKLARALGRSSREFKKGLQEEAEEGEPSTMDRAREPRKDGATYEGTG